MGIHLVDIDGYINCDVHQVSEGQASDERVRSISHAFVLLDNPEQSDVPNDPHSKNEAGQDCVDVLEDRLYGGGPQAAGGHLGLGRAHRDGGVGDAGQRLPPVSVLQTA